MHKGKILGIDYGTKRIGIAISDENQEIAFGRTLIENLSKKHVLKQLKFFVTKEKIVEIIVGYPLNMDGEPTKITLEVDKFIKLLENDFDTKIIRHEERLTSKQGDVILSSLGVDKNTKKNESDIMAATIILQNYLDSKGKTGNKEGNHT